MKKLNLILFVFALILTTSCSTDNLETTEDVNVFETQNKKPQLAIWADCEQFLTVGTNTNFKPNAGNFDEIYVGANFPEGLGAISETQPGDQDYNGGRWHVNTLKEGVDPDKYWNTCTVEDLDLEDFESTDVYFECPMIPSH